MAIMIGFLTVSLLAQIAVVRSGLTTPPPGDATVKIGQNASFLCLAAIPSDNMIWKKEPQTYLFQELIGPSSIPDATKYIVNITGGVSYNFTIMRSAISDGGTYGCQTQKVTDEAFANLLVVDTPALALWPSTGLVIGNAINITCTVNYGGPATTDSSYPFSPTQDLQLTIQVGSNSFTSSSPGVVSLDFPTTTKSSPRKKFLSVNKTLAQSDTGYVNCSVSSTAPSYRDQILQILPMTAPTTKVTILYGNTSSTVNSGQYDNGDVINCTADGYPQPTVGWTLVSPQGVGCMNSGTKGSGWAALVVSCQGKNNWNCTASNNAGRASQAITFTVVGSGIRPDIGRGFAVSANWQHCLILILAALCYIHYGGM